MSTTGTRGYWQAARVPNQRFHFKKPTGKQMLNMLNVFQVYVEFPV